MATATPSPLASSPEKTNGNKLSRLLIDGGTTVLRNVFDRYHPPANLASGLKSNYSILNNLLRRRVLNGRQWDKLFPPGGKLPYSNTFDITLLFLLLTNICGLSPPLTGWHTKPSPGDNSLEANLARVKFFRNELYGHVTFTGVDATSFSSFWHEISTTLYSLGLDQAEIDRLKAEQGGEEDYLDALIEWADSEEDIKTQLKDIHQSQTKTEETISQVLQTQLKLSETQCKTQDVAEEVLKATNEAHQQSILRFEKVCDSQSKTIHAVDVVHESIQEVKQEVKSLTKKRNKHADEVLKSLVMSEFKGDIEYHAKKFQEGTREWIFKRIEGWLDDRSLPHKVMVISGNPGMGKTVVSAVVSQRMQKAGRLSGSHFCQHNNSRYRDPRLMLQSLACHLCQAMPSYKDALEEQLSRNLGKDLNSMGVEELFALLFKEPLSTVQDPGRNTLIVIDGLDESEYQGRNELLHVISNHFSMLPVWIRILITTRPERSITEALRHLQPIELEQKQEENLDDIRTLFEIRFSHKIGEEHKDILLKELVKKSEGLFIYAYFIVDFVQKNVSILTPDQLERVFPSGISSVYSRYFKRLENELCKELNADEEHFLRFLCALTASREPLPVEFIAKILYPGEKSLSAQRKVKKAISSISTLLPVREGRLHFFHKSIKDWLVASSPYEQHHFTVNEKEGHIVLSHLCASELDSVQQKGVHGKQFSNTETYALHHGTQHMLKVKEHDWADKTRINSVTAEQVYRYATDLELIYAKLCVKSTTAIEDLLSLHRENSRIVSEERDFVVTSLLSLLRKHSYILFDHPHLFFQCLINEGTPELSSAAARIIESSTPKIPCMKNLDNDKQNEKAVQGRFYCSDKIAYFDVSPEQDYLVCECQDETIHLFSLHTGTKVWVRPSPIKTVKREYGSRELHGSGAYRRIKHSLSFFHSVIFHPNGKSVLPGTLRYVYTISGEIEDLFPDSDCSFSNCVVRSRFDKNLIFTTCYTEPKRMNIWDMENGQKLKLIECNDEISSFAVSEDGTRIAICDITNKITLFDEENQFRFLQLGIDDYQSVCGLMQFTSDNNTLVCCFLYWQCDQAHCRLGEERKPIFTFIRSVNNISLPDPHFEPLKFRTFLLWPSVPPNTLTEYTFMGQNEEPSWVSKAQREIPYLFSGSYISLNDEKVLIGSPDHKYVTMLNAGLLQSKSDSTHSSNVNMGVRKIIFSMEGDAIYVVSSGRFVYISSEVVEITIWRMTSREFLKTKTFFGPVSIVPTKEGLVLFKNDRVAELWNFDLSKCIRSIAKLTSDTTVLYKVRMIPVSDELIAFFYPVNSQNSQQNEDSFESKENEEYLNFFLKLLGMHAYRIDFVDLTSVGGKLVSSLRIPADAKECIDYISCSRMGEVLVCIVEDMGGPINHEKLTVRSLRKNEQIKWERRTEYLLSLSPLTQHMIFSPTNEFVVTWNTLDGGQGIHVLQAETGETLHVFLRDQKDIIECKFLDDESLVCCSGDNFLRLYNVRTGDLLSVLDIGEQPLCLGACLNQPLVAIGLSGTRIKFFHVQLPTESKKKN
ncbi:unnamed protein product [Porites lobata]|uniref:NACHT domain-containing protein n=1 Tax=Porites lobata TaxID=104759 RepID=A0ABN8RN34_9CNID|nr:unnamed protein product [Porites lobata]